MKFKAIKVPAQIAYTKGGHRYTIPEHYRLLENDDDECTGELGLPDLRVSDGDPARDDPDEA